LIIEPQHELKFKGPFTAAVTSYMKLTNPSEKKVIFKIKTTAPKKYCVRPNSGVLDSNDSTELAICLQPFIFDPSEKNKHKFMVQSMYAPDGDFNMEQIWKDITPDQLMDSKLKCVFEMPAEPTEVNEEPVKVSPKVPLTTATNAASNPPTNFEIELQKAADEVQQLREEESMLRAENLRLKEEILRLSHSSGVRQATTKYTPAVEEPQQTAMARIVVSVLIVIFGIILGKFVL